MRDAPIPALVAFLVMASLILARFADEALPGHYLMRPLGVAVLVALLIGASSLLARQHAASVAAGLAVLIVVPAPAMLLCLVAIGIVIALLHRRGRFLDTRRPALVIALIIAALGAVRVAAPFLSALPLDPVAHSAEGDGPPVYLVLLDGYPRIDTLADLGVENAAFVAALEKRGFDHYADAQSAHSWTQLTLLSLIRGSAAGIEDEYGNATANREVRAELRVPPGFVAIDPPVGHVVLNGGRHLSANGINDFEAHLLSTSAVGVLAHEVAREIVGHGLRDHLEGSLNLLATTPERSVFAHLMAPHPPFLYAPDGSELPAPECWPQCNLFDFAVGTMRITQEQWADGMTGNLEALNGQLLGAIDAITARHPDAVIVLFSDHGARYSYDDRDEWHRSFLAGRTPNHSGLFADEPRPDAILRIILQTYR